jgi:large conductance mechanosensitive channel
MLKDFKKFVLRGNVVDLAVAVVIGAAFGAVVTSLVKDIFTPLIAAIIGKPDFSNLSFTINKSVFLYGDFLNALIAFLSIAVVVFFFVVQPINKLRAHADKNKIKEPDKKQCPECLSMIPIKAKKCMYCTSLQKI